MKITRVMLCIYRISRDALASKSSSLAMEVSFQNEFLPKLGHPSFAGQQKRFSYHGGFLFVLNFKSRVSHFIAVKFLLMWLKRQILLLSRKLKI